MLSFSCLVVQDKNAKFSVDHTTETFSGTSNIPCENKDVKKRIIQNYADGVCVIKLFFYVTMFEMVKSL